MKRILWIAQAAWYLRGLWKMWKPRDLAFCIETAAVIYHGCMESYFEIGRPKDEVDEELTYWND